MIGAIVGGRKDPYCFTHQLSEIYGLEQNSSKKELAMCLYLLFAEGGIHTTPCQQLKIG